MKWFHKDSDARKHKMVRRGKAKFGKARFGLFFNNLLEVMAEFYRVEEPDYIEMPWSDFAKEMEFDNPREKGITDPDGVPEQNQILFQMVFWIASGNTIRYELRRVPELNNKYMLKLYYPSFRERADDYTRKVLGQRSKQGSKVTTDQEEEEDKKKKRKEKQKGAPQKDLTIIHPIEKLTDPRLNKAALKNFYDWRKDERKPKSPMGPMSISRARNHLVKFSHKVQQEIVDKSILSNWQGLFEPDKGKPSVADKLDYDPYDTPIFKKGEAMANAIKPTGELVVEDEIPETIDPEFDIDWEGLSPEEKKQKWQELKKKACRKL